MALYETSALITAPVEYCFNAWMQFDEFPDTMPCVREVRRTGEQTSHWRVVVVGREAQWDAKIISLVPNRSITWKTHNGLSGGGTVAFYDTRPDFNGCRVAVLIEYNPPYGLLGDLVDICGFEAAFRRAVLESLAAFKQRVETSFAATAEGRELAAAGPPARRRH
ncbi:MAG: SRPBCC family protein [Armatimonadetes bacterium]|nr:SRPBCC family protein [Armatimonadota bacterium]